MYVRMLCPLCFHNTDHVCVSRVHLLLHAGYLTSRRVGVSRRNEFAQQVGEEFLAYFDFSELSLVEAVRVFLQRITLAGETQERERVLVHFSRRYLQCNPGAYNSEGKQLSAISSYFCGHSKLLDV